MRITKKAALLVAVSAFVGILPMAVQGAPDASKGGDVSMDLDAAGLAPAGPGGAGGPGRPPMPSAKFGPPGIYLNDDGNMMFIAKADDPDAMMLMAMGPPGGPGGHGGWGRGHGNGNPFADLNLTDDQYEKLFALHRDNAGKDAAKMGEMMSAQAQMHDLMLQPEIDRARITSLQTRINAIHADLSNAHLEMKMACLSVLTPEQRHDLRRKMLRGMSGMGGPGMGHGMPGHGGPGGRDGCAGK
jgi:Spy/CpxP family protein refolding chaperone